jgi:release factor glutamine methyltransferase
MAIDIPTLRCHYGKSTVYVATDEIVMTLMPEVSRSEPLSALDGGRDGLDYYRRLSRETGRYLRDGGVLLIEIGASQEEEVVRLIRAIDGAWREVRPDKRIWPGTRAF